MATVGRGADQYTVRFPDGLRDRVKEAAERNSRSMNAEIVATLEEKYPAPQAKISLSELAQMMRYIDEGLDTLDKLRRASDVRIKLEEIGAPFSLSLEVDDNGDLVVNNSAF